MVLPATEFLRSNGTSRVADQIVVALYEAGVRTIFGVPGGAISAVYDALMDEPGIRVINANHETTAVYAAAAYARATGSLGVVLVTSGPGVTNAMTGIASAFCDGLPVMVLGGEVARKNYGRGALQEGSPYHLNLVSVLRHVTKLSAEVLSADQAIFTMRKAMATCMSGRKGPVFLSVPLDIQGTKTATPRLAHQAQSRFSVEEGAIQAAAHTLLTSERPIVVAGSGTRWGQGPTALKNFAERFNVPVATTPKAKGVFPESHPLSLGVYGLGGHPAAIEYLRKGVDTLIAVGTSLGDMATNSWSADLAPANFIQIDIDSAQIGRNYAAGIGLVGDAGDVLNRIAALAPTVLPPCKIPRREFFTDPEKLGTPGQIKPQRALWELQRLLPSSTIYTCDIGDHTMFALHYLMIDAPDAFYLQSGLGGMGSGVAAAIGVKLAHPDRPVVAVCGDGTIQMSAMDLSLAAGERLNIIYCVLNDSRYGMVEAGHKAIYGRTPDFKVSLNVAELTRALGAEVQVVERPDELLALGTRRLLNHKGPLVIDVRMDPNEKMPRLARFDAIRKDVAGPAQVVSPTVEVPLEPIPGFPTGATKGGWQ